MKNNLLLGLIFFVLVGIAYYFEEIERPINENIEKLDQERIIGASNTITEIKTKNFHLIKSPDGWALKNTLWKVDQEKVAQFIDALSGLNITGSMSASDRLSWENHEQIDLKIHGKVENIVLLGVSKVTGSLYLSRSKNKDTIYIVKDEKAYQDLYQNELDLNLRKYSRLLTAFNQGAESFLETNLLKGMGLSNILHVKIENKRKNNFQIHIEENITRPLTPESLIYKTLLPRLTELMHVKKIVKVIERGKNILSDKRSSIIIEDDSAERIVEYYLGLNGNYGHFLKIQGMDALYEIELNSENIFTAQVEDFWQKKFPHNRLLDFSKLEELSFELKMGNNFYPFYIKDLQKFEVLSRDEQIEYIDKTRMNFLFNLLLNLTDFKEANSVEEIKDSEFLSEGLFVKAFDKTLIVQIKAQEIIVDDTKNHLRFSFSNKSGQVGPTFFEKIFTVKNK